MSGVDGILNYKKVKEDNFYEILGCDEHSSVEQITTEYKVRALQYHPDKNAGDKEAEAKFQKLKEAKETLCDPEKKLNYDKWRNSGISISYRQWLGMKEHVHQSMHWSTPKTKDRMLPEAAGATGGSGTTGLGVGAPSAAHRRASEGGAALHYGSRTGQWASDTPNEMTPFRSCKHGAPSMSGLVVSFTSWIQIVPKGCCTFSWLDSCSERWENSSATLLNIGHLKQPKQATDFATFCTTLI